MIYFSVTALPAKAESPFRGQGNPTAALRRKRVNWCNDDALLHRVRRHTDPDEMPSSRRVIVSMRSRDTRPTPLCIGWLAAFGVAEPSDKPLRHKGTDLVRLETPLPAITVYAVKGAPTGETSWDNIDLTLREISEATVEKQEEALRKKRSLSSRCPSYKNSAPAGRQIKQTEDTGFETPTKPHGILGRLKGLFGKFRK